MVKCTPLPQPHLNEFCRVSLMHGKCATYLQLENKGWSSGITGTPVSSWTATYCWPTGKLKIFSISRMCSRLLPKFNELFSGHNLPIPQISWKSTYKFLSCPADREKWWSKQNPAKSGTGKYKLNQVCFWSLFQLTMDHQRSAKMNFAAYCNLDLSQARTVCC